MSEAPNVRVHLATSANKAAIAEMMQAYQHDMAQFTGDEPDVTGHYTYRYFDDYWSPEGEAEGRIPYLIIVDDAVVGFAFVNRYSRLENTDAHNIAEFFVKGSWRRNGVGKKAVQQILTMHSGHWEIAVLRTNTPAFAFWTSVVNDISKRQPEITVTDPDVWDGNIITLEI